MGEDRGTQWRLGWEKTEARNGVDPLVRFGPYRDLTLQQILRRDKEYCRWLLSQSVFEDDQR